MSPPDPLTDRLEDPGEPFSCRKPAWTPFDVNHSVGAVAEIAPTPSDDPIDGVETRG